MPRVLTAFGVLVWCATASAAMPGHVTLSDGRLLSGKILFATEKLRLQRKGKRAVRIRWDQISAIQVVTWRDQTPPAPGPASKALAPVLEFRTRIILRNGACLWGILSTRFTIQFDSGLKRSFGLTRQQRGKAGQTSRDLVHVVQLLLARMPGRVPCQLTLTTEGVEQITSARLFGVDSQHVRELKRDLDGQFRAECLWPDRYDLLVVTPRAVYLSLSGETPTMPADVLTYERRRSIGRWLGLRAGEGVKRRALTLAGRVRRSRVLVLEETRTRGVLVERRLDLYQVEYLRGAWTVRFIVPVYRDTQDGNGTVPLRWLNLRSELAVSLGARQLEQAVLLRAKVPEKR